MSTNWCNRGDSFWHPAAHHFCGLDFNTLLSSECRKMSATRRTKMSIVLLVCFFQVIVCWWGTSGQEERLNWWTYEKSFHIQCDKVWGYVTMYGVEQACTREKSMLYCSFLLPNHVHHKIEPNEVPSENQRRVLRAITFTLRPAQNLLPTLKSGRVRFWGRYGHEGERRQP